VKTTYSRILIATAMSACAGICSNAVGASLADYKDSLDVAVEPPDETAIAQRTDHLSLYVGDDFSYDDNLYRLPNYVTDLATLPGIGPNPSRGDHLNSVTAGADTEWLTGTKQSVDLDLRADDNRYVRNTNLDNISTNDRVAWNWGLGNVLSGLVGADYARLLGGFVNTGIYSRDIVVKSDYFASLRYQVGPRWGIFGGVLYQDFAVTEPEATYNNYKSKAVDIGIDYSTNAGNRIGFDYRYTDDRFPNAAFLNGVPFDPDFRENRARVLLTYALSDKTTIDASAGYLQREYPNNFIGNFSGDIWRISLNWQATPKIQLLAATWRQLTADLTAQTDYYRSTGVELAPIWTVSEKVTLSAAVSHESMDYIGSNPEGVNPVDLTQARHDTLTSESGTVAYAATRSVTLTFTAAHDVRDSNAPQFQYKDFRADLDVTYKFFHYGDMP
jgi:exopolysaccharide biosynthesis operon protein EpsL